MTAIVLINEQPSTMTGEWVGMPQSVETGGIRAVQATVKGTGAVTATIRISGAIDGRFPVQVVDFTLSGTGVATEAVELPFPWEFYRAEVIAISGTAAKAYASLRV